MALLAEGLPASLPSLLITCVSVTFTACVRRFVCVAGLRACTLLLLAPRQALADDGELSLPDGRRLLRCEPGGGSDGDGSDGDGTIPLHPDFRMIVLANRPGCRPPPHTPPL